MTFIKSLIHKILNKEISNIYNKRFDTFNNTPKGELTIVLSEKDNKKYISNTLSESDKKNIKKMIKNLSIRDITNLISQNKNISKKEIYDYCLKLKNAK